MRVKRNQTLSRGEPIARVKICKGLNMSALLQSYIFLGGDSKQNDGGNEKVLVFLQETKKRTKQGKLDDSVKI